MTVKSKSKVNVENGIGESEETCKKEKYSLITQRSSNLKNKGIYIEKRKKNERRFAHPLWRKYKEKRKKMSDPDGQVKDKDGQQYGMKKTKINEETTKKKKEGTTKI